MSHIDDLIAHYCPGGVPHASIRDVAKYVRGITYSKHDEQTDGPIEVLRANNITLSSNTLNFDNMKRVAGHVKIRPDQRLIADDILLSAASGSKAHVGKVAFIESDLRQTFGGFMAVVRVNSEALVPRFLFHVLIGRPFAKYLEDSLSTTTINNLSSSIMGGFTFPVPPLEVQREIVRLLDHLSEMETQLESELESELKNRKSQYATYRDQLFTCFDAENVGRVPMGELGEFFRGSGMQKSNLTEEGVPAIHYGQVHSHYGTFATKSKSYVTPEFGAKLRKAQPGDLVIATTSEDDESVGKAVAWIGDDAAAISGDAYIYRHSLDPKYVAYFFQTDDFQQQKKRSITGTKVRRLSGDALAKVTIPVRARSEQERISALLDKFEALLNDLSIELQAELAARRTQYEYYCDRLLTFEEAKA